MDLNSYFEKGSQYLKKKSINLWLVTAATLTFNAFGILHLLKGDFELFITLIITSQIIDMFDKYNRRNEKKTTYDYNQLLEWIKLITIFFAFTRMYTQYITPQIIGLVLIILILSNIDFSIKSSIEILEGNKKDSAIMFWTNPFRKLKLENLKSLEKITNMFNESLTFFYIIIIMISIYINS